MSEQDQPAPQPGAAGQGQFLIQKVYVKDLSFETPNSPEIFRTPWQPSVDIQLNNSANKLDDKTYEVVVRVTVTVKVEDKTAFLVEVNQAGIFAISGLPEDRLAPVLGSFCPNILFPYVRETVSDLIARGGFPQMLLAPVNFDALYAQQLQEQQAAAGSAADAPH